MKWCPTGEMTVDLRTKPNQGSNFIRFRDLIMVIMPQIDPSNGEKSNRNKKEVRIKVSKVCKSNKISEKSDRNHKLPQECVVD